MCQHTENVNAALYPAGQYIGHSAITSTLVLQIVITVTAIEKSEAILRDFVRWLILICSSFYGCFSTGHADVPHTSRQEQQIDECSYRIGIVSCGSFAGHIFECLTSRACTRSADEAINS